MTRLLSLAALVIFLGLTVAAVMLYLVYGVSGDLPDEIADAPVTAETTVGWHDEYTSITSADEAAIYTALGLAHGVRRTWTISLWRQVALGRSSEWYGPTMAGIDSLALQLRLGLSARDAYRRLPEENRRLLDAYADGVNLALERRATRLEDEFAVLGVSPERWEPWHSLAVERLFSWLAVPPFADTTLEGAPAQASSVADRSELLEEFLGIHDLEHSAAFVTAAPQAMLGVRFVYGSAVLPLLEEHAIELDGERLVAAVLPGTPFPFMTTQADHAFVLLPRGAAEIQPTGGDTLAMHSSHERISDRQGREYIISFVRGPSSLLLGETRGFEPVDTLSAASADDTTGIAADTVVASPRPVVHRWILRWHGLDAGSDAAAFREILLGRPATFSLFRGGSVRASSDGEASFDGPTEMIAGVAGATASGHPKWVAYLAERLSTLQTTIDSLGTQAVFDDVHSTWAEQLAPSMVEDAGSIPDPPRNVRDALTYLRNWNYEYEGSNIAASVFDRWIRAYHDSTGSDPSPAAGDTLFPERYLRYQLLRQVVESMESRYGGDMSQWRWERTQADRRHTPGFIQDHPSLSTPRNRRYETVEVPGGGHPSTPRFGTTPLQDTPPGSASWEAWASISALDSLSVRRRRIDLGTFRGRYMISEREPPAIVIRAAPAERQTILHPPAN